MDDKTQEKTNEETKNAKVNSGDGNKSEGLTQLERVCAENERLEKNIVEARRLNAEAVELETRAILGGNSLGAPQHVEKKEDDPIEYSKKVLNGEVGEKQE